MKKLLLSTLILNFLFAPYAFATTTAFDPGAGYNQALHIGLTNLTSPTEYNFGRSSNRLAGNKFIPNKNMYLCQIDFILEYANSATDGVQLEVWNTQAGDDDPFDGVKIADKNNIWLASDIGAADTWKRVSYWFGTVTHPGNCIALAENGIYWFVLSRTTSQTFPNNWIAGQGGCTFNDNFARAWREDNGLESSGCLGMDLFGISNPSAFPDPTVQTCDGNFITQPFCLAFQELFIPLGGGFGAAISDTISALKSDIELKVPFAYFSDAYDAVSSEPGEQEDVVLTIPFVNASTIDLPIIDTDNEVLTTYQDAVFPWMEVVLWLTLVWYLFARAFKVFKTP